MKMLRLIAATLVLTIAGCATTSVNDQWKDPSFTGPPASSVVVVGIARSDVTRRVFEDTFAQDLNAAGIHATPSYTQIPAGDAGAPNLPDFVRSSHADAVLATRVQRVQQKVDVSPGYVGGYGYGGFYGWYGSAWAAQPMISQYEVVTLETTLWDTKSEKLIWAATTQRIASQNIPAVTTQLAQTLIPRMKAAGVLR